MRPLPWRAGVRVIVEAVPVERVRDATSVEPELAKRLLVLGLAEDRHVARQELLAHARRGGRGGDA